MGQIIRLYILVFIAITLLFISCDALSSGYINEHKQYVPKRPKFQLKGELSKSKRMVDTEAVYQLVLDFQDGDTLYPDNNPTSTIYKQYNQANYYIKFYENGRYLQFYKKKNEAVINSNHLTKSDLNPDNEYYIKGYYNYKNNDLLIERFFSVNSRGWYDITKFRISSDSDSIISDSRIYVRKFIPIEWDVYPINW